MKLNINHWDGSAFQVDVEPSYYVDDLKDAIQETQDIPVDQQRLTQNGENVDDTATMEDLGLKDGDTLTLDMMKILVILPDGKKRLILTLLPTDTIKKIKKAVSKKAGIKADLQCVIFDNQEYSDGQTLAECNIEHDDAVAVELYTVTVSHWDGEIFQISNISPRDTVDAVKEIIMAKTNVPIENQKYIFKENPVNEFLALKDQQIKHCSLLELQEPPKAKKEKFKLSVFPETVPGVMAEKSTSATVSIRHFNGTTFKIDIDTSAYVDDLKEKIKKEQGIPIDQQRLSFKDKEVDETETLGEQDISCGSVLVLEPMKIFVQLPNGKKIRFTVNVEDTIKRIKRVVTKKGGLPADVQVVKFNDVELSDGKKLADVNVVHCDTLIVETFSITVMDLEGEAIEFSDVSPKDTIEDIKLFTEQNKNYPYKQINFLFEGKKVNEFLSLGDQGVKHKGVLEMEKPEPETKKREKFKMSIFGATDVDPLKHSTHGDDDICLTIQKSKTESFAIYFAHIGYVEDLKEKIQKKRDIKVEDQRLSYNGKLLENDLTLVECDLENGSTLVLEPMKVCIVLPNGKKMKLTVNPEDHVRKLKKAVFKKAKIAIDVQCLMYHGEELNNGQNMEVAGIAHEDEIKVEIYSISIAHWLGDIFVLTDVSPSDTVDDLRDILLKRKQIPKEMQKFTFEGHPVNEYIGLKDQKIKHKSILVMEDLEIIKSPKPKRATISEIKYVDTDDEESVSDDSSEASWLKRCALDEDFTADLVKIDTSNPEKSWLAYAASVEEEKKEEQNLMAPDLDADN